MPRHPGSLNRSTIDKMVADGDLCLLSQRLHCVKCREARQKEETESMRTQVDNIVSAPELAGILPPRAAARTVPAPAAAMMLDTFLEYKAPDGKDWRVERGADLIRDFDIAPAQIRQYMGMWHQAMAGQERVWLILRRLYGIAPMLGVSDMDEMRVWALRELGKKLGLDDDSIHAMVGEAKLYFARYRSSAVKERSAVKLPDGKALTESDVDDVLQRYEFEIIGEIERRYAAKRCLDLQPWLEHETGRPMAKSAINQELLIFYTIDRRIADHQAVMLLKRAAEKEKGTTGSVNDDMENERLGKLTKMRADAVKSYEESMTKLGATQVQTGAVTKRQNFQLCVGKMVEGMQLYYSQADNSLLDGFATEAEIVISATETDIRPPQYRPDVALGWVEAMDNLWRADYEPTPVGRERAKRLRQEIVGAVKRVVAEKDDDMPTDLTAPMEQVDDLPGSVAPLAAAPAGLGEAAPTPLMPGAPLVRRGDGNDVAVF